MKEIDKSGDSSKNGKGIHPILVKSFSETLIWYLIGFLILFPALLKTILLFHYKEYGLYDIILENYYIYLLAVFIIIFPVLFRQIFGMMPFALIRSRLTEDRNIHIENVAENSPISIVVQEGSKEAVREEFLLEYANESKQIAEKIFQRSGTYLLIGSLIALFGVAIFYSPIFAQPFQTSTDLSIKLVEYLPRFGSLFFIEFIAFFFLRQYRIMLEEYRYYESVKRFRQEKLVLLKLIEKHTDNPTVLNLIIQNFNQQFSPNKLSKDETTEMLETKKLLNQEQDVFSKLTDLIKEIKGK